MSNQAYAGTQKEAPPHRTAPRLAYLVSEYPAFSHTFILHEVLRLKALGFFIRVASINAPDRAPAQFTADEAAEAQLTYYVKSDGARGALKALSFALLRRPLKTVRGLFYALGLGGTDLRKIGYGLFYFIEALMVGAGCAAGLRPSACPFRDAGLHRRADLQAALPHRLFVHGARAGRVLRRARLSLAEKIAGADFVLAIGTFARSQLMKLSPPAQWDKFDVCPLGVDPELFQPIAFRPSPEPVGGDLRRAPGAGEGPAHPAVGHGAAARPGAAIRLRLVGDGPDRASLGAADA
jgi:colanic acid/amylovoran biosynthesis glycosyltransferase